MINNKKYLFLSVILHITFFVSCSAQKELSKNEVLKIWKDSISDEPLDKNIIMKNLTIRSDIKTNNNFSVIFDSLRKENVDTLCIYMNSSSGGLGSDSCSASSSLSVFFFWQKNNKYYVKKLKNHCYYKTQELTKIDFFKYFDKNYQKFKTDFFMPVITKAKITLNNKFRFSTITNTLDEGYGVYFLVKDYFMYFNLIDSYISNKKSMFYSHNRKLKSYTLFKLISKRAKKLN